MAHHPAGPSGPRSAWIALAPAGPVAGCGDAVTTAADDQEFLSLLDHARPRIAIVTEPPATSELVERVAVERRRRTTLRIVHHAADDAVDQRLHALRLGFDDALPLGIPHDEFRGRLELLDEDSRVTSHPATRIALGNDLELDLSSRELRRDGLPVHLRPKEFGLLAMLAGHPGRAYTRRQLLDRVWGLDHDGDPRTVDVHVRWLRSKIEAEPGHPVRLVTIRGIGYRLDPPEPR
jgi:DNA-binding response OmpR family regulator